MPRKDLTRRSILKAGAGAAGLWGVETVSATGLARDAEELDPKSLEFRTLGPRDITGTDLEERLVTVSSGHMDPTSAGIGPGSPLFMEYTGLDGNQRANFTALCTANFVWKDTANDYNSRQNFNGYYLGAAGHCFNPLGSDDSSAPRKWASQTAGGDYPARKDFTEDLEDGDGIRTKVCVNCIDGGGTLLVGRGANPRIETVELGDVVYARDESHGANTNPVGFDFGIVEIPADAEELVKPSMPVWGGPVTVDRFTEPGTNQILQYGNGVGAGETVATKNRAGTAAFHFDRSGDAPDAYDRDGEPHTAWYATLPAAPGDSGSGVQTPGIAQNGPEGYGAAGNLTHLALAVGVSSDPQAGVGTTAGTPIREAKVMVREDTRLVLNSNRADADPFDRPLGNDASFGTETAVEVDEDGPDSIERVNGEGDPNADVTIDADRLKKARRWLISKKGIRNPIELEVVTPDRWSGES
jgi:hypothetical protein